MSTATVGTGVTYAEQEGLISDEVAAHLPGFPEAAYTVILDGAPVATVYRCAVQGRALTSRYDTFESLTRWVTVGPGADRPRPHTGRRASVMGYLVEGRRMFAIEARRATDGAR